MAPPSLTTMSMSLSAQTSADSLVSSAKQRPRDEADFKKNSSQGLDLDENFRTAAFAESQAKQVQEESYKAEEPKVELSQQKLLSYEEIARRKKDGEALIVVDGNVYDVAEFLESHPGGPELILEHLKSEDVQDAGPLMRGKADEDEHSHSKAAFRMLDQFFVGSVKAAAGDVQQQANEGKKYRFNLDLTKPIVPQVGYLGADYDEWVHDPIITKESPRFFESDVQEFFTRTKWWVIPLVWVPVALLQIYLSVFIEKVPFYKVPGFLVCGAFIWTLIEYCLHRFLFHMKTSSFWANTFHYTIHGFHHKHPMDGARLVFPPVFTAVICSMIWILVGNWIIPYPVKLSMYAGGLLAYIAYDLTHYFLHFGTAFNNESRKLKRYHLNHHFKDQMNGYGITTTFWDRVFRTLPSDKISAD